MADPILPDGFRDLEPLARAWALPTEWERNRKRHRSSIDEIRELYEALLPRMDAIMEHLNGFSLDALEERERRLLDLALALAEVAPAVEFYKQPGVLDGFDAERFVPRRGQ